MSAEDDFYAYKKKMKVYQIPAVILATIGLLIALVGKTHTASLIGESILLLAAISNIVVNLKFKKLRKLFLAEENEKEL